MIPACDCGRRQRAALCTLIAVSAVACGGGPSAPSAVDRFPNIVGTWSGPRTVDVRLEDSSTRSNVCDEAWTVTSQSDASFAGEFRLSGGVPAPCGPQSGSIAGTIATSGAIVTLSTSVSEGQVPCLVVSRSAPTGGFSDRTLTLRFSDEIVCAASQGTVGSASRSIAITLTRQ